MSVALAIVISAALVVLFALWRKLVRHRRAEFIRTYVFPKGLFDQLAKRRPGLERKDIALVSRALRHFFLAYLNSGRRFVSMPSQVVDDLWHEFILYTRNYEQFCNKAFGGFFHHSPAVTLTPARRDTNAGLRRVWWHCCKEENIDARKPSRLPLLFALDAKLAIAGGFVYAADCAALRAGSRGDVYCGGDFSDSSIDGGTSGFGEGAAESGIDAGSDSGASDGGGCGGGGCGGGGCGGD